MTFQEPSAEFPRVLVVAHNPFSWEHNNGLLLSSLFQGWPPDCLAQIHVPSLTRIAPARDICSRYWALTLGGLAEDTGGAESRPAHDPKDAVERESWVRRGLVRATRGRRIQAAAEPVREWLYGRRSLLQGEGMDQVRAFRPDVILSTLGSLSMLRIARRLGQTLSVPVVPFFTDDWIHTSYRDAPGGALLRRQMNTEFRRVVDEAPARLVISDGMAEEYAQRYTRTFLPFTRCVDADRFPPPTDHTGRTELKLVYAGQVSLDRWRALQSVGRSLHELRTQGIEGRLVIYTTPLHVQLYEEALTRPPVMQVAGHVPSDTLPAVYEDADVLVHVESFRPDIAAYTRFSQSTKMAECLMSGRPLLGFGPGEGGSMRHIQASGGGLVVGEDSERALTNSLRTLLTDAALRRRLGAAGRSFASQHHESKAVRSRFRAVISEASRSGADGRPSVGL